LQTKEQKIMPSTFLTAKDAEVLDVASYPTLRRWEAKGLFPRRHELSPGKKVWLRAEVDEYKKNPTAWREKHGC
jgi:predicted DNA-binding transcriptional regulator AlpA